MALLEPVDVDNPAEARVRLETVELAFEEQSIRTQVDEAATVKERLGHFVDLGVQQRLATGNRDHGGAGLLNCSHRLLDTHPLAQDLRRVLNLSAPVAREVAGEERLQLHNERELLAPSQLLTSHVRADLDALAQWDSHLADLHR